MARSRLGALALVGMLSGCNWYYDKLPSPDDLMKLVPWFDHMITSPVPAPYQRADIPRRTPRGAVPITGAEADWGTGNPGGNPPTYGFDTLAANRAANPTDRAATVARGDSIYTNFCAVCHGTAGDGKGPVGPRIGAPSLLTDLARGRSDGYLYSIVRYGRGVMPSYGDKIHRPADRWAVVNYLRQLQGVPLPAAPAVAPEGTSR